MRAKAEVHGRREARTQWGDRRYYTWLRIPTVFPGKILTMMSVEEEFLPYGVRTADAILVEVDPQSLYQHHSGYAADIQVLGVWDESSDEGQRTTQEDEG